MDLEKLIKNAWVDRSMLVKRKKLFLPSKRWWMILISDAEELRSP